MVQVGDIFYASWGYDQTNVDFMQVVEVSKTGKTVKCKMTGKLQMSTESVGPCNKLYGEVFQLKVSTAYSGEKEVLRGRYPFCGDSKRFDSMWKYEGEPVYETPEGFGH